MNIKEKIQAALDSLEMKMKSQAHLKEDRYESVIEDVDFLLKNEGLWVTSLGYKTCGKSSRPSLLMLLSS